MIRLDIDPHQRFWRTDLVQFALKKFVMGMQKILIALDQEPVSARAAEVGAELARAVGGEVALIHVNDGSVDAAADVGISPEALRAGIERDSRRLLAGFIERLGLGPSTIEFVQSGAPAATIAKAAKDWAADLIVIGSHGRSGMRRALLGSVAEEVMRQAPCPVLVVRAQD
jgi:universal stress protein A